MKLFPCSFLTAYLLLLASPFSPLAAQGPLDGYLKGKGVLDVAPSFSFLRAASFAGAGGQTYDLAYQGNLLGLFAEYGLSRRVDLVGTATYVFTSNRSGLQDGGLYVKYRPYYTELSWGGKLGILAATGLSFPLTDYEPAETGALGQKAVVAPLRLIVQWESALGIFFNVTGGYNWRLDRLSSSDVERIRILRPDYEVVRPASFSTFLIKAGLPAQRFYLDGWVEWQHTYGGVDYIPQVPDLPQVYGVSYTQFGATIYYSENGRNGFTVSSAYTPGGRNTSRLFRITAGMVFKFL